MHQPRNRPEVRVSTFVGAGLLGFGLGGLLIGRLTLSLNPHLYSAGLRDPAILLVYFTLAYGAVGAVLGLVFGLLRKALTRLNLPEWFLTLKHRAAMAILLLGSLLYVALLPDAGLNHGLLGSILFGASKVRLIATAGALAIAIALAGLILAPVADRLAAAARQPTRVLVSRLWAMVLLLTFLTGLNGGAAVRKLREHPLADPATLPGPAQADSTHTPLLLLNVDGLDPDDMVLPMVARGELPNMGRMIQNGVFGELKTFEPTLSAIIWTTIITGKTPEQHGIRHFIVFRLPGLKKSIYTFPRHTGLNFRLFPVLEHVPGMPALQAPYTSNMRQCDALWNIIGRVYPVGVYRWLVTWPAEALNGFNVAGGVGWLQIMSSFEKKAGGLMGKGFHNPTNVYANLPPPPFIPDVTDSMLAPYTGQGFTAPPDDWKIHAIAAALRDPTIHYLPLLIDKYKTKFTAASFYSVDEFCHYFTTSKDKGGLYSRAIESRYKFTDDRLGELLSALGDSVNVILVSDHGYDFKLNHHTYAPNGAFIAMGPAFRKGAKVDGLNVYDIAPLCLTLMGFPLAEDMPRFDNPEWRQTLLPDYLARQPGKSFVTYETGLKQEFTPVQSPIDEQIKEQLRSLGYIN